MQPILNAADALWQGFLSDDAWMISQAMSDQALYWIVAILILPLSALVLLVFRYVPFLDRNLERWVMIVAYSLIGTIIFVEVIRRFAFNVQSAWSTTLPPMLFLIMTWVGCSYNVRLRSHLSFSEFRTNFPPLGQLACSLLDTVLWYVFGVIVIVATMRQTALSASNFQMLQGTDDVMLWWFYIVIPVAWLILCARVLENTIGDIARYRANQPVFVPSASLGD